MATILIAVDDSEYAAHAFTWYVENFHKPQNKVYLVTCPEDYTNIQIFDMSPGKARELQAQTNQNVAKLEQKFKDLAKSLNVPIEKFIVKATEKPGHGIVDVADEVGATTVVTGTRGMGKIRRTIMGSVSDFVMHHANCPVLVCRQK